MKRILLPLEDTERSLKALHYAKKHYATEEAEFVLLMVDESLSHSLRSEAEANAIMALNEKLRMIAASLDGYRVTTLSAVGKAGVRVTRAAREVGADLIIMTKSSKPDMLNSIGSTTEHVLVNAPCDVIIVSESAANRRQYRGLIYRTANGVVNLRGQLGDKQSECLLPSVNQDCIYNIDVTVGTVRFFHTAYNPDTRNWDQLPKAGQEVTLDISAGESKAILVKADSTDGKADRIRIVNRDMKKEAVFSYSIRAAVYDEDGELKKPEEEEKKEAAPVTRDTIEMPRIALDENGRPVNFEEPEVPDFRTDAEEEKKTEAEPQKLPEEPVMQAEAPEEKAGTEPAVHAEELEAQTEPAVQEAEPETEPAVQEAKSGAEAEEAEHEAEAVNEADEEHAAEEPAVHGVTTETVAAPQAAEAAEEPAVHAPEAVTEDFMQQAAAEPVMQTAEPEVKAGSEPVMQTEEPEVKLGSEPVIQTEETEMKLGSEPAVQVEEPVKQESAESLDGLAQILASEAAEQEAAVTGLAEEMAEEPAPELERVVMPVVEEIKSETGSAAPEDQVPVIGKITIEIPADEISQAAAPAEEEQGALFSVEID